jgi:hypothetical protein
VLIVLLINSMDKTNCYALLVYLTFYLAIPVGIILSPEYFRIILVAVEVIMGIPLMIATSFYMSLLQSDEN